MSKSWGVVGQRPKGRGEGRCTRQSAARDPPHPAEAAAKAAAAEASAAAASVAAAGTTSGVSMRPDGGLCCPMAVCFVLSASVKVPTPSVGTKAAAEAGPSAQNGACTAVSSSQQTQHPPACSARSVYHAPHYKKVFLLWVNVCRLNNGGCG